ncbi:hypothetical protein MD484_g8855, partial [Candolleomyces efflorescens]
MSRKRSKAAFDPGEAVGASGDVQYPSELFKNVHTLDAWTSPTKSSKQYRVPLKRRKASPRKKPLKGVVDYGRDDSEPSWLPNVDADDHGLDDGINQDLSVPVDSDVIHDDQLTAYAEAVDAALAVFQHIGEGVFVVQGWDKSRKQTTCLQLNDEIGVACTCAQGLQDGRCVHSELFKVYETETLLQERVSSDYGDSRAPIFFRQHVPHTSDVLTMFSVRSLSSSALKGRAIVQHTGTLPWKGTWKCSKEPGNPGCAHIKVAYEVLKEELKQVLGTLDDETDFDPASFSGDALIGGQGLASLAQAGPVSHLPILPPISAVLRSDPALYARPLPFRNEPAAALKLDARSSCPCPSGRTYYRPDMPSILRPCRVFTLYAAYDGEIELQACPNCPAARRRFIGPDLREHGLFNFNNRFIVSHELLDEYTMSYVTSETPFVAWCSVVAHRYLVSGSQFMSTGYFTSIWFGYAALLALDDDMRCLRCGPSPETTIWDGITLAFGKKHLAGTLVPPTVTSPTLSISRPNTKHRPKQQLLTNEVLRAQLRRAVKVPSLDDVSKPSSDPNHVAKSEVLEHLDRIQWVYVELSRECKSLAELFQAAFGAVAYSEKRRPPADLTSFFLQIAAEESILQMVNGTALGDLDSFLANPSASQITMVLSIPAIYKILRNGPEMRGFVLPLAELIPLLQWIRDRAANVLGELRVESQKLSEGSVLGGQDNWKVVRMSTPELVVLLKML